MSYEYGYKAPGTVMNGILKHLQLKHPDFYKSLKKWGDINIHLKAIRLQQEPNRPVSNSADKNSKYISENYKFIVVINYFNNLTL
jgi:hypothetical protein